MNHQFPVPEAAPAHGDNDDDTQESTSVSQFVYSALFLGVNVVVAAGTTAPPPVDTVFGEDASGQDFIIKRRKLSYLGS